MLPEELPPRDPLENPPPDPPRAFAKEIVGTPTKDNTRHAAINLVVFKRYVLSMERENQSGTSPALCMSASLQAPICGNDKPLDGGFAAQRVDCATNRHESSGRRLSYQQCRKKT